jgi:hypothetical protein
MNPAKPGRPAHHRRQLDELGTRRDGLVQAAAISAGCILVVTVTFLLFR